MDIQFADGYEISRVKCLHPNCALHPGITTWAAVAQLVVKSPAERTSLAALLTTHFGAAPSATPTKVSPAVFPNQAALGRLLECCPCLYNQIDTECAPAGVVHLCEVTLGAAIKSANAHEAFLAQHPAKGPPFSIPPAKECSNVGGIVEALCSEVLTNEGIPRMEIDGQGWPLWQMPGHIVLNSGKMSAVKAFGDILIPAAPSNIVISVKSETARERLLYSANMIEGVGFGFFTEAEEFWSKSRMNLFKRMGFTAIYLPDNPTYTQLVDRINAKGLQSYAVNINGKPLYRPLSKFGEDMRAVVGRITLEL